MVLVFAGVFFDKAVTNKLFYIVCYMKKSFILCLLFTVSVLFASENGVHRVSLSYGLLNTTGASVMAANALVSYFGGDKEDLKDVNLLTMSSFNVAYGYELWGK